MKERFFVGVYLSLWYALAIGFGYYFVSSDPAVGFLPEARRQAEEARQAEEKRRRAYPSTSSPFSRQLEGIDSNQEGESHPPPEHYTLDMIIVGTLILGALGSVVTCTRNFIGGSRRSFRWYFFSPFVGMLMAAFVLVGIRAGMLALTYDQAPFVNPNIYFFVAIATGLFAEIAYRKLQEVADSIFALAKGPSRESDDSAKELDLAPTPTRESRLRGERLIRVSQAASDRDLEEVYRLRFRILCEQEGWKITSADNVLKTAKDDYDNHAFILVAKIHSEEVRGSVRSVLWGNLPRSLKSDDGRPRLLTEMGLRHPNEVPAEVCSLSSRLVVAQKGETGWYPAGRSSRSTTRRHTVGTALCVGLYHFGVSVGIHVDWITCFPHERKLYEKLGYRQFAEGIVDPDFVQDPLHRECLAMYLLLDDIDHLKSVRSPFVPFCRSGHESQNRLRTFREALASAAQVGKVSARDSR